MTRLQAGSIASTTFEANVRRLQNLGVRGRRRVGRPPRSLENHDWSASLD